MGIIFGANTEDFRSVFPMAVIILTPNSSRTMDRTSLLQFLAVLIGSIRGDDEIRETIRLLWKLTNEGMRIVLIHQNPLDMISIHTRTEGQVKELIATAMPDLTDILIRCRPGLVPDALHGDALTFVVWVFQQGSVVRNPKPVVSLRERTLIRATFAFVRIRAALRKLRRANGEWLTPKRRRKARPRP